MANMQDLFDINQELSDWLIPLKDHLENNNIKPTETQKTLFEDVDNFFKQFSEQRKKHENEPDEKELSPIYRTLKKISESLQLIFDDFDGKTQGKKHIGKAPDYLVENLDTAFSEIKSSLGKLSPEMKEELNKPQKPSVEAFEHMLKQINDADPMYIRSSKDFRAAKDAIKDVIKLSKSAPESYDKDGEFRKKEINNKICDALDYAQLYVRNKKKEPNLSDLAKKRIATMEKVVEQLGEQYGLSNIQCKKKDKTNGEAAQELEEQSQDMIKMGRDLSPSEVAEVVAKHKYAEFLKKEGADGHYNEIMATRGIERFITKVNEANKQTEKFVEAKNKQKNNNAEMEAEANQNQKNNDAEKKAEPNQKQKNNGPSMGF